MVSVSVSTSPGNAAPTADASPSHPRHSLRLAVLLALVPICVVVGSGITLVAWDARVVHRDLQRLFEEQREIGLCRTLVVELQGIEAWLDGAPDARASTQPLVLQDVKNHLATATATLARFLRPDDPSAADHQGEEQGTAGRIATGLAALEQGLAGDPPLGSLRASLDLALHGAAALDRAVDHESREIGDGLDHRSSQLLQILVALGLCSVATFAWLGFWLLRRVLQPVRELRRMAVAIGRGDDVAITVRRRDELGDLAATFQGMAQKLREHRLELEERVEARSREVLRTARLAELGSLAAGMAHEINNPLASIATCAEGLLRETAGGSAPEPTALRDYLTVIKKEAMRTSELTSRLLRFARHEPARRAPFDLGAELRDVVPMFTHQFADAYVQLELHLPEHGPRLHGDAPEWRQVLFNLIRNALDACDGRGRVTVHCRQEGGEAVVEVDDTGPGFPAEALEHLFEPFFTTKGPGKGTGLGLAIVHRIVSNHGGTVQASNLPQGGARLRIVVPADAAD